MAERAESPRRVDDRDFDEHGNQHGDSPDNSNVHELREYRSFLLVLNSLMMKAVPHNAMIATDAEKAIEACVIAFIHYISGKAKHKSQSEMRRMVTENDILYAMSTAGFDHYMEHLDLYMRKYREHKGNKDSTTNESGESSSAKKEGGEEERGTAPEVVAPEYEPPLALAVDTPTGGSVTSSAAPSSGPEVVTPEYEPSLALAVDPPTGGSTTSSAAPSSGPDLAVSKSGEASLTKKEEGEEEGDPASEVVAPQHMPPALTIGPPTGGSPASPVAPPLGLDLASLAFYEAPQ